MAIIDSRVMVSQGPPAKPLVKSSIVPGTAEALSMSAPMPPEKEKAMNIPTARLTVKMMPKWIWSTPELPERIIPPVAGTVVEVSGMVESGMAEDDGEQLPVWVTEDADRQRFWSRMRRESSPHNFARKAKLIEQLG